MKNWNVLLVDDEPMVLRVHGQMISKLGHVARMYSCPERALEYVSSKGDQIDLVITDYRMPGISGLDFIRQLRSRCATVPVLMLTGYASEIDLQRVADYGVEVLEKPVGMDILIAYLEALQERVSDEKPVSASE